MTTNRRQALHDFRMKQDEYAAASEHLDAAGRISFLFDFDANFVLYRAGRPTSVVLLLLMIVAKLSLPLSRHPPLGLHHLLRLVGSSRRLVALSGIEILKIRTRMAASAGFVELHRMARTMMSRRNAAIYIA